MILLDAQRIFGSISPRSQKQNIDINEVGALVMLLCSQKDGILMRFGRVYLLFHFAIRETEY